MSIVSSWKTEVKKHLKSLTLPEYMDDRTYQAANILISEGLVKQLILVGPTDEIQVKSKQFNVPLDRLTIVDPKIYEHTEYYIQQFFELRQAKGMTLEKSRELLLKDVCFYSAMMLRNGHTDAVVLGAFHTSGDVIRAGIQAIGTAPGVKTVSGCFYMESTQGKQDLVLGDCAVLPEPTSDQLADIAVASADTYQSLSGVKPKVAFLSFSTMGSADHPKVANVRTAVDILRSRNTNLEFDGEMQFDAAMVPEVGSKKAPQSQVAGHANVLIFPELNAGNIGYKIMERSGTYNAYGPIIQGLAKPYNDLSRGCSVDDIVVTSVITLLKVK